MKKTTILFLLLLSIIFVNCSKEEKEPVFDAQSLKQTTWEGILLVTDGEEVIKTMDIVMQFFTEKDGKYILKQEGSSDNISDFTYSIDGKIMTIEGGNLTSKRTLLEFSKDKIVLEIRGGYKSTITLNKVY